MFLLVFLTSIIGPRVALGAVWLFTGWIGRAIDSTLIAALGFLLAPWTTLAYVLMWSSGGLSLLGWVVVGLGVFADVGSYGGSAAARR